jgi:hypothetical protein
VVRHLAPTSWLRHTEEFDLESLGSLHKHRNLL